MKSKSLVVPKNLEEKFNEIASIIGQFCKANLNKEYELICVQLCAALSRKRPSPLLNGRSNTWACGIVHAIGSINFLFDSAQSPSIKPKELYEKFGVSGGTGSTKSKQIRDIMKLSYFDPDWTLPSKMEENPLVWMITVNGFVIDVRHAPKDLQEEAFKRGLIPYLPN